MGLAHELRIFAVASGVGTGHRAEDRNSGLCIKRIGLPSTFSSRNRRITNDVTLDVQHIRLLFQRFAAELTTEGQTNTAGGQVEERRRVDRRIQRPQLRGVFVLGMHSGKIDRGLIRRNRSAKITEGIKRYGRADKLRRCRIKDWIGLVQNAVESRSGHLLSGNRILELAVTEPGVVAPASVEELVPLDADGAQPRVGFVIEQSISKLSETSAGAAGDDLLEGIKRIERVRGKTGLRVGWRVGWLRARRNWRMRRNGQCSLTQGLEGTGCW